MANAPVGHEPERFMQDPPERVWVTPQMGHLPAHASTPNEPFDDAPE
jgi:hypothetical protein